MTKQEAQSIGDEFRKIYQAIEKGGSLSFILIRGSNCDILQPVQKWLRSYRMELTAGILVAIGSLMMGLSFPLFNNTSNGAVGVWITLVIGAICFFLALGIGGIKIREERIKIREENEEHKKLMRAVGIYIEEHRIN